MKKTLNIILLLFFILLINFSLINIKAQVVNKYKAFDNNKEEINKENRDIKPIGGDRDEHGCLVAAGYSWNETEKKCVREWEQGEDRYQKSYEEGVRERNQEENMGIGQELREQIRERKEEIRSGEYNLPQGQLLRVRELVREQKELRIGEVSTKTNLDLFLEKNEIGESKLKAKLKNGEEKEIKIMPNRASEIAIERLKLKVCNEENDCTIELKEVAIKNRAQLIYEVQAQKEVKILGLFRTRMRVETQLNAENGEIIKTKKPWWSFLSISTEK